MFTIEDVIIIKEVIKDGGDKWNNPKLLPVKTKIKNYYRTRLNEQCCYCRKNFEGEFNMVIDIEHILPKNKYEKLMFIPLNLSISCKRCNMKIKGHDISFITSVGDIDINPFESENYKFIHPNLDDYFLNLKYFVQISNNNKIVKYKPISPKGAYTYKYFRLKELEIESLNKAQGIISNSLNDDIPAEIANELNELFVKK
jgi:hypothetical protein